MKKLDTAIYAVELAIGCLAMAVIAILVFSTVIARYFFKSGILWADEVIINTFVLLVMMGSALCFRFGKHVEVTLFINALPKGGRKILRIFLQLTVGVFLLFFLYGGIALTGSAGGLTTSVLRIPMEYIYAMIPTGTVFMIYEFVKDSIKKIRSEFETESKKEGIER